MRINGNGSGSVPPTSVQELARQGVAPEQSTITRAADSPPMAALPKVEGTAANRPQAALPAEPPPGTDPELWNILSVEERVFFARLGAMGPLTYGRMPEQAQTHPTVVRGGRLNVRA